MLPIFTVNFWFGLVVGVLAATYVPMVTLRVRGWISQLKSKF